MAITVSINFAILLRFRQSIGFRGLHNRPSIVIEVHWLTRSERVLQSKGNLARLVRILRSAGERRIIEDSVRKLGQIVHKRLIV